MSGTPFYNTVMGSRFFNSQLPSLIQALNNISASNSETKQVLEDIQETLAEVNTTLSKIKEEIKWQR